MTLEEVKMIHMAVLDTLARVFPSPEGDGVTVRALSNYELAFFLLAIASEDGHMDERESAVIDDLCGVGIPQLFRAKAARPQIYERVTESVPATLVYFVNEENARAHADPDTPVPHLADRLIALYSAAGYLLTGPGKPGWRVFDAMMDRYHAYAGAHQYKPEPPEVEAGLAS